MSFSEQNLHFNEVQIKNFLLDYALDFISKSYLCTKLIKVFSYGIFLGVLQICVLHLGLWFILS